MLVLIRRINSPHLWLEDILKGTLNSLDTDTKLKWCWILGQYSAWAQGFLHNQCYLRRSCCVLSHKNSIRETWLYTKFYLYNLEDKELRYSILGLLENWVVISYKVFHFIKMELQCIKASKSGTYLWYLFFIDSFLNDMISNLGKGEEVKNYIVLWQ